MVFGPCALTRRSGEKRKHDYGPQEKLSGQAQDAGPKDPQRLQTQAERTIFMPEQTTLAPHLFTHTGDEVLILKCVAKDGSTSYNGFKWPLTVGSTVTAPDWRDTAECGGGLHGWPWGFAIGDGKDPEWSETWLVFGALSCDVVSLGGKCKARTGTIRYVGDWQGATNFVLSGQIAHIQSCSSGAASSTGDSGAASSTGYRGAASSTGDSGAASSTGSRGAAVVTGLHGKVQGGKYGCIALAWWNSNAQRAEMRCAETGIGDGSDGKLKAFTWYRLDYNGLFVEIQ
jgi:hypothetical protein